MAGPQSITHNFNRPPLMSVTAISPVTTPAATSRRSLRILYADDLRELRDVARISLTRDGHRIECVPDGEAALERVQADPALDLVITDHHMPLMNGLELVTALRRIGYHGRILVFSSELSPTVAAEYRKLAVDQIIYKPVFPSALRQILATMFELPTAKK